MIQKKKKGEYGYRNFHILSQAVIVGICIVLIVVQLVARNFVKTDAAKNILTVMAILSVLPMANLASPFVVSLRYRSISGESYKKISACKAGVMLYDLLLTPAGKVIPADAVMVHPMGVFVCCGDYKMDVKEAESSLNEAFKARKLDLNVKVFDSEDKFVKRLRSLKPSSEYEDDGSVEYAVSFLKSLSM